MFKRVLFAALIAATVIAATGYAQENESVSLTTPESHVSYSIGYQVGHSLADAKDHIDTAVFLRAIEDVFAGRPPAITEQEMKAAYESFQQQLAKGRDEQGKEHAQSGAEFLKAKEAEDGVTKTDSGLLYKVISSGEGRSPEATDTVQVHYEGKLTDGTVFDSSYDRGEPIEFALDQVIAGWTEGVQLMKEGGKFEFYIPYDLAYGPEGRPGIPPYAALIFQVELLAIR